MVGKRLVIPVSQGMCAMRHISIRLNGFPALELGRNFAQGVVATGWKGFWRFSGFAKIMCMYLHNRIPERAERKVLGDLGCSLSYCRGLQDAALSEPPFLIGNLQHVKGGRALVMGTITWQL